MIRPLPNAAAPVENAPIGLSSSQHMIGNQQLGNR